MKSKDSYTFDDIKNKTLIELHELGFSVKDITARYRRAYLQNLENKPSQGQPVRNKLHIPRGFNSSVG